MSIRIQQFCSICGPLVITLMTIGLLLAGFIPPPSPNWTTAQIAAAYRTDTNWIHAGLLIVMSASALFAPFFAFISVQLKRIEGCWSPCAYAQLILGATAIVEFVIPLMLMQGAAFRADRSPDSVQTLNDVAWLMFLGIASTFVVQLIVIGVAILADGGETPVLPRWLGYYNIWAGVTLTAGSFCVFFKTGPLAWDGVFVWWMPLVVFGSWFLLMGAVLYRSIDNDSRGQGGRSPSSTDAVAVTSERG